MIVVGGEIHFIYILGSDCSRTEEKDITTKKGFPSLDGSPLFILLLDPYLRNVHKTKVRRLQT